MLLFIGIHIHCFFFLELVSWASMSDDILALAKFYLLAQEEIIAIEQNGNGKFTFLLFSCD